MNKLLLIFCALWCAVAVAEVKHKVPPGTTIAFPMAPAVVHTGLSRASGAGTGSRLDPNARFNNAGNPGGAMIPVPGADQTVNNLAELLSANIFQVPPTFTLTITSIAGAGAVPTEIAVINNDKYPAVDDNGSGAASITYAWQDGSTDGTTVSELIARARPPYGLICFGVAMRVITNSVADPIGLAASNPVFKSRTSRNNTIPIELNPSVDQTRDNQDFSIEVMPCVANVSRVTQLFFTIPGDTTNDSSVQLTFYFVDNYKR